jgi:hypothetical protein
MRKSIILCCALGFVACGNNNNEIVIDEQNHLNEAYNLSYELATRVKEATTHNEFRAAADELEAYNEAFRTQIGGESYLIFIEECNTILNE